MLSLTLCECGQDNPSTTPSDTPIYLKTLPLLPRNLGSCSIREAEPLRLFWLNYTKALCESWLTGCAKEMQEQLWKTLSEKQDSSPNQSQLVLPLPSTSEHTIPSDWWLLAAKYLSTLEEAAPSTSAEKK